MRTIHRAEDRMHTRLSWLDSHHTFSFGEHHDPRRMGFSVLRVINDDTVSPGRGFGTHPHRDMEILSWVLDGGLSHKDSLGTGSTIRPGELQRMSAGTGIAHSEHNASATEPVHFLQIWILPERAGLAPGYEQRAFPPGELDGALRLVGSRDGRDGSITVHQDVDVWAARLAEGQQVTFTPRRARAFLQVSRGALDLEDDTLTAGDGVAIEGTAPLRLTGIEGAEVLIFDLP